jgi:hypothetical protein
MKIYQGKLGSDGFPGVVTVDGSPLDPRNDLFNHSPDGFAWGYGGSGPAQLALAILADCLGDDERAVRLHQTFKWLAIAPLPQTRGFVLDEDTVRTFVASIRKERNEC